ncbi:hypothetical protein [Bacillus sp. FJAT-44742]|uniref:hypothetical protein n=1 Tax=Bacillus sp. FJAT-44742 TaxID=2014005 RepID=UPI000C23B5B5|nr:hypothetical protein [Bacillus sp. FJAT-44742]
MSVVNSSLQVPDPFIADQNKITTAVAADLERKGFETTFGNHQSAIDLRAAKGELIFHIESRGNQALAHIGTNKVYKTDQISIHLPEQVNQIMRFMQSHKERIDPIFIIANPDIKRFRLQVSRIEKALNKLGIVQAWVDVNGDVTYRGQPEFINLLGLNYSI